MIKFKEFSFGATSAIITSVAVIIGLSKTVNAKINIISALLIIAIADNISDSFGIHMHQECQRESAKEVNRITIFNFISRLIIILIFIAVILLIPMTFAVIFSVLFSAVILIILSYYISKNQKTNPYKAILQHLIIAIIVIIASFILREVISYFIITV
jgi:VIT1/CCC1 family predicted Fe2+/Mn2+ transporter